MLAEQRGVAGARGAMAEDPLTLGFADVHSRTAQWLVVVASEFVLYSVSALGRSNTRFLFFFG